MEKSSRVPTPLDVLKLIALPLDLPELLDFCQNPKNKAVCSSKSFWKDKLFRDFKISDTPDPQQTHYREYFNRLYTQIYKLLTGIKDDPNYRENTDALSAVGVKIGLIKGGISNEI